MVGVRMEKWDILVRSVSYGGGLRMEKWNILVRSVSYGEGYGWKSEIFLLCP